MYKQFNMAPISAIGSLDVRRRSWENVLVLIVIIVSLIFWGPQCLGLPYWLPYLFLERVSSSSCAPFLDRHITLLWLISIQYPGVINPIGRPICWIFWHLCALEGINLHGRLLELLIQVSDGCSEVCDGFTLGHHHAPVCCRRCSEVNEGIVGVLPSFSEVVCTMISRWPGGNF